MKKIYILLLAWAAVMTAQAQMPVRPVQIPLAPGQTGIHFAGTNHRSGTTSMTLDYDSADRFYRNQYPFIDSMFPPINPFDVGATFSGALINANYDTTTAHYGGIRYAIQTYDTLIDPSNNFVATPLTGVTAITVDSFSVYLNDSNSTGASDSLTVSVFDVTAATTTGSGWTQTINTIPLWSESFGATIDLLGPGTGAYIYLVTFYPAVTLPAGHTFGIRIDFKGDVRNQFIIGSSFRDDCGYGSVYDIADVNWLAEHNSSYYCSLSVYSGVYNWNTNTVYAPDIGGAPCDFLPFQNFYIFPSITIGRPACPTITATTHELDTVSADVTASGGAGPYTYSWNTIPPQTRDTAINLLVGHTYTVTVTDTNGCTGTASVTIAPASCPTITATATQLTPVSADVSASGGTGPYTYRWSTVPLQTTDTATALTPGNTYTVTAIDHNGCTGLGTVSIACPTITVTPTELTPSTAYAAVSGGTGPYTYRWSSIPAQTSDTATGLTLGTAYTVTVTDHYGCSSTGTITLTCATITATASELTTTSADVSASGGLTPYTYRWSTTPAQTTDTATGLTAGNNYTVTVTDHNGCTGTATVSIVTGISSTGDIMGFSIYPNPSNGLFTASVRLAAASDVSISIQDITGSRVYESTDRSVRDLNKSINLGDIAAGIYIITVRTAQGTLNQRIAVR